MRTAPSQSRSRSPHALQLNFKRHALPLAQPHTATDGGAGIECGDHHYHLELKAITTRMEYVNRFLTRDQAKTPTGVGVDGGRPHRRHALPGLHCKFIACAA